MINDGSTDDSWAIMKELAAKDSRIEIYTQPNCGVAATRNSLLDKVKGDFVLFVDSDDWIELDTIESLIREQEKADYDIVMFRLAGPPRQDECYNREQVIKKFLEHTSFRGSLCDKLVKSSLYKGLRIDESVSYGEDTLLVWQVLQRVSSMSSLSNAFYHYRRNENSLSRQSFNGQKFSAYTVWDTIARDVEVDWPQYKEIALARFACEMTLILRDAEASGYKKNDGVRLLQKEIRRDFPYIKRTGLSSTKMILYAWLVSHHYQVAGLLSRYVK
jgi:glycosyltransferase involved in cell wall biosynthesis